MSSQQQRGSLPLYDDLERLFVNNHKMEKIAAFLNRFNPIKTMKMESMEIRHSAILAWLLDPKETHGLDDRFLKLFLGAAFLGDGSARKPTALDISKSELRDAEVKREWKNIDILIYSAENSWAFIIENKFHASQTKGQLSRYLRNVNEFYKAGGPVFVRGVFLTLWEEEPEDPSYSHIQYSAICEILERILDENSQMRSKEVEVFLLHYMDVLKEASGMSNEQREMEQLARELYREHKKVLDFVIEHGSGSDFALAARTLFGENSEFMEQITIDDYDYAFERLGTSVVSFLPFGWYEKLHSIGREWPGCNGWWAGYPLNTRFELSSKNEAAKGQLRLVAEVGPAEPHKVRQKLIESMLSASEERNANGVSFQKGAADEGKKYSKFLKGNSVEINDVHDADEIATEMKKLLKKFRPEFDMVSDLLSRLPKASLTF